MSEYISYKFVNLCRRRYFSKLLIKSKSCSVREECHSTLQIKCSRSPAHVLIFYRTTLYQPLLQTHLWRLIIEAKLFATHALRNFLFVLIAFPTLCDFVISTLPVPFRRQKKGVVSRKLYLTCDKMIIIGRLKIV